MSADAVTRDRTSARTEERPAGNKRRWYTRAPLHFVVITISVLWLMPTIALLFTSVRSSEDIVTSGWWTLLWKPHEFTLQNYTSVMESAANIGMGKAFINSLIITIPSTFLPIILGAAAAYGFAWLKFPMRNTLFLMLVGLQIVPLQMILIPLVRLFTQTGIQGHYAALWVAHTAFGLPWSIYIMRNFMSGIPYDLLESARIDGASDVGIFTRIILPLTTPAIAAVWIFQFMWVWNDLLMALIFASPERSPMPVVIRSLVGQFGTGWHFMTAAAFISMILPLLVFFGLQRYFVAGLTAGSVKG